MLSLVIFFATLTEVHRVQDHLAGAEAQLRAADLGHLSSSQRASRARVIEQLADYRERGVFPRNLDFDERTPYFIDDRGVRCAMAHLIELNGGATLVAEVAATRNNAYVRELAADPRLLAWLDAHGMTVAEAARVQPAYERAPGTWCNALYDTCAGGGACGQSPNDDETPWVCNLPCEPGGAPCPVGMQGVALECLPSLDGHRCYYPGEVPGSLGASCDPDVVNFDEPGSCNWGPCDPRTNTCIEDCWDSCEDPDDVCVPWDLDPGTRICRPAADPGYDEGGGCSTAPGAGLALAGALAALFARRRRR